MEILNTIWLVISVFSVIFTVMFVYYFLKNVRAELNLNEDVKKFKQTVKLVYIEQVDDMFRMHDKFTHQYICQASTEKELWDLADAKFPNVKVMSTSIGTEVNKL
jgi:hypothetical protein